MLGLPLWPRTLRVSKCSLDICDYDMLLSDLSVSSVFSGLRPTEQTQVISGRVSPSTPRSRVRAWWGSRGSRGQVCGEGALTGVWGSPAVRLHHVCLFRLRGRVVPASSQLRAVHPSEALSVRPPRDHDAHTHGTPCRSSGSGLCPAEHLTLPAVPVAWAGRPAASGLLREPGLLVPPHPALSRHQAFSLRSPRKSDLLSQTR